MTKSFTSMIFVAYMFASAYGSRFTSMNFLQQLPHEGRSSFEWQRRIMEQVCDRAPIERITLLGGGPFTGIARECGLKLDEIALLRTKTFQPLELRHGPHAAIGPRDLAILFLSDSAREHELSLLSEIKARGAATLLFADRSDPALADIADFQVLAGRGTPEPYRGILYAPFIQYLACLIAIPANIDPDNPQGLTRVVSI